MLDHTQPYREMESCNDGVITTCKILKESNIPFLRYCIRRMVPNDWARALWTITVGQNFLRYSFCARRFRYIKINLSQTITIKQSVLMWTMMMSCITRHLLIFLWKTRINPLQCMRSYYERY